MLWFANFALWLWLPLVLLLFLLVPARQAVVGALITSWLFLPQLVIPIQFLPNFTKVSATSYALLLGALLLDPRRTLFKFRPVWTDIPMGLFMFSAFMSSLTNKLGTYDAFAMLLDRFVQYGIPYLLGRTYFQTLDDAKELCKGILLGGLVYVPLCMYEMRMSPQLHKIFYGFHPFQDFSMAQRWGGFRPTVFMQHGLMVGVWMATAAATSFWLWRTRAMERFLFIPMWLVTAVLMITTVFVKATGAIVLLMGVLGIMWFLLQFRSKLPFYAALIAIPTYLVVRSTGMWDGIAFSDWLGTQISPDRAESLWYRLTMENATVVNLENRGLFGWGGWGRAFKFMVYDRGLDSFIVPDSFWIVTFGANGYYGLITVFTFYLLGPAVLLWKMGPADWISHKHAPVTALALVSMLYAMDCLFNAMVNPIFIVILGSVTGMAARMQYKRAGTGSPVKKPTDTPPARTARPEAAGYVPPGRPQAHGGRP